MRPLSDTVVQAGSVKKVFLKILQYSQEIPVLESLFNKVAGLLILLFHEQQDTF